MPRVREGSGNCVVTGLRLLVNGKPDQTPMKIAPHVAQIHEGAIYSMTAVTVIPDSSGRFQVALPPGFYTADMPTWTVKINVPNAETADFESIIVTE